MAGKSGLGSTGNVSYQFSSHSRFHHLPTKQQTKSWKKIAAYDGRLIGSTTPLGQFLERYIICEAVARKLIADKTGKPCPGTLQVKQINSALKTFNFAEQAQSQLVERIFLSGKGIRDCKTPRQLRNAIVHGISEKDCSEVTRHHVTLMKLLELWLKIYLS